MGFFSKFITSNFLLFIQGKSVFFLLYCGSPPCETVLCVLHQLGSLLMSISPAQSANVSPSHGQNRPPETVACESLIHVCAGFYSSF